MRLFPALSTILFLASVAPAYASGGKITFTSDRTGKADVYVVSPNGSGLADITNTPDAAEWAPKFNDLGSRIICDTTGTIWVGDVDGGNSYTFSPGKGAKEASFITHSSKLAYSRDNNDYDIYTCNPDGSNETLIVHHALGDYSPDWSPDGTKMIFRAFEARTSGNIVNVFIANADGTEQRYLSNTNKDRDGDWSPDGGKVVFGSTRDGNSEIYVMNADGTNPKRLTNNAAYDQHPCFSPDGKRIVFQSNRDGNEDIYIMDVDGSNVVRLTNTTASEYWPNWGPDNLTGAPSASIGDVTVVEGTGGSKTAVLPVTLSAVSTEAVTVTYSTYDENAIGGTDYAPATLQSVVFPPGTTVQNISVPITTDSLTENTEVFDIRISAEGATIAKQLGTVTIQDDDAASLHTVSGRCVSIFADGTFSTTARSGVSGATVLLLNSANVVVGTAQTDVSGNFIIPNVSDGNYQLTASAPRPGQADVVMDPPLRPVTVNGTDVLVNRFALYSIFGIVKIPSGSANVPVAGAVVQLFNNKGVSIATRTTGADGCYEFKLQRAASFTITVSKSGYNYVPKTVNLPSSGQTWSPCARAHMVGVSAAEPSEQKF